MTLREKIEKLTRRLGISADELADRLGVKRPVMLNWLTGRVKESPKGIVLDYALEALREGFDREFVLRHIVIDGPLSLRGMAEELTRMSSSQAPGAPASPSSEAVLPEGGLSDMESISREAFEKGHYIQCALILFQAIETLLRVLLKTKGQLAGIPEATLTEAADREPSFLRLTLHLDLLVPDNGFSDDLRRLNRRRNDAMHRLFFEFESRAEMESKLRKFCQEARRLRDAMSREVKDCLDSGKTTA